MAAKKRKPAIEKVQGIDDIAKWLAKNGGKAMSKKEVLHIKKYARGIGFNQDFEKNVEKKLAKAVPRNKAQSKLKNHLTNMADTRQDKFARVYGDSNGPHERFFSGRELGKAESKRKEYNALTNKEWNKEVAAGRKNQVKARTVIKKSASKKPSLYKKPTIKKK
jgi:hypothetical protein